jgi:ATP-dependent Lon protease
MVVNQNSLPVLPLRDIVVFPDSTTPLFVGREKSINALDFAMNNSKKIVLLTQKNPDIDNPNEKDLYSIGTVTEVLQLLKLPDGTVKILVEGKSVSKVIEFKKNEKFLNAQVENCILVQDKNNNLLSQALVNKFNKLSKSSKKFSEESNINFKNISDPNIIANKTVSTLGVDLEEKQKILETLNVKSKRNSYSRVCLKGYSKEFE